MNGTEYALKVKALTEEFLGGVEPAEPAKQGWENLITRYRACFHPPELKIASLAQWILESGRGTSALSKEHLNYGGIKYRPELEGVATPVRYGAHDGTDSYAKFETDEDFIEGYWRFIERSPYKGWENHTSTPLAFVTFLKECGYATDPSYVSKVAALFPEAANLLGLSTPVDTAPPVTANPNGKIVVLDPGHGGKDPGAVGLHKLEEEDVVLEVCLKAKTALEAKGYKVYLTRERDESLELSFRTAYANKMDADVFVSVHCNAAENRTATGTECLYRTGHKESLALASAVQKRMVAALSSKNRGVKASPSAAYPRSIAVVRNHASRPATLVELDFISAPSVEASLRLASTQALCASAIANGISDYFAGLSKPSTVKLALNTIMAVNPA